MSTFEVLRALHGIIGDGLDDIERVFADHSTVPPPKSTTPPPSSGYSTPPTSPSTPHKPSHTHLQTPTPRTSPPQSPISPLQLRSRPLGLDFPSLDFPSPSPEPGTTGLSAQHLISTSPVIGAAINRIVSACGQMSAT